MRVIDILNDLDKKVGLKQLVGAGIVPVSMLSYRDIYLEFDVFLKTGYANPEAVKRTADMFNVTDQHVYRIKVKMEHEENFNKRSD